MATSEMSDAIRTFLSERRFGVMATINPDGSPQQTTVWYELQGDEIMLNTAAGRRKDRNLRRDNRTSMCVEDAYRYVSLAGNVELIDDQSVAQRDIHYLAQRYHGSAKAAEQMRDQFSKEHRVTIRLGVHRVVAEGFES